MELHPVFKYLIAVLLLGLFGYFFGAFVSGIWNVMCWDVEGRFLLAILSSGFGLLSLLDD